LSTSSNRLSYSTERLALIITGYVFFSSRYAYFKSLGKGFNSKLGSSFGGGFFPNYQVEHAIAIKVVAALTLALRLLFLHK
jgi:hypothetical protein